MRSPPVGTGEMSAYAHSTQEASHSQLFFLVFNSTVRISPVSSSDHSLLSGQTILSEGIPVTIHCQKGELIALVAGVFKTQKETSLQIKNETQIKKVVKPWGYELWLNGQHPGFAFKRSFIQAGNRTSLQYHQQKRETNVLFQGHAHLHFRCHSDVPLNEVKQEDISQYELKPISSVDIYPKNLDNILLYYDNLL